MYSVTIQNMIKGSNWAILHDVPDGVIHGGKAASQSEKISFALSEGNYIWRVRNPGYLPFELAFTIDGSESDYEFSAVQLIDHIYQPQDLRPKNEVTKQRIFELLKETWDETVCLKKDDPREFIRRYNFTQPRLGDKNV